MMITFRSKAAGPVSMFGDVAVTLLKLMGQSGQVPGALLAADIAPALARLRQGLSGGAAPATADAKGEDEPPPVTLRQRAYPLIELLSAAADKGHDVSWESGQPLV
ncbi:MAG TPA: DUF1840 domain-containing protein [Burkholderiales bacterium]|nr:DUF1840 domain-containing protein [Burkholderiales bacterium]